MTKQKPLSTKVIQTASTPIQTIKETAHKHSAILNYLTYHMF